MTTSPADRPAPDLAAWLAAGRQLLGAATSGPYGVYDRGVGYYVTVRGGDERDDVFPEGDRTDLGRRQDAEAIAGALNRLPAALDALAAVLELTYASDDGTEHEHVPGCKGEPECPACWAAGIRHAITAAIEKGQP